MFGTLAALFPPGLAMTISTVPISLTILMLLSPQRSKIAVPYLVGWVSGVAFFATVLMAGLLVATPATGQRERFLVSWAEIALGLVLIGYAVAGMVRKPRRASEAPRWVGLARAARSTSLTGGCLGNRRRLSRSWCLAALGMPRQTGSSTTVRMVEQSTSKSKEWVYVGPGKAPRS